VRVRPAGCLLLREQFTDSDRSLGTRFKDARLRLHFEASKVFLVLGGHGSVQTFLDGRAAGSVRVDADRLYTLVRGPSVKDALLELRFSPGVNAYAFTFG
jgi:hypothetical protein